MPHLEPASLMCSFLGVSFFYRLASYCCLPAPCANKPIYNTHLPGFWFLFLLLTNLDLTPNLMSNCCTFPSRSFPFLFLSPAAFYIICSIISSFQIFLYMSSFLKRTRRLVILAVTFRGSGFLHCKAYRLVHAAGKRVSIPSERCAFLVTKKDFLLSPFFEKSKKKKRKTVFFAFSPWLKNTHRKGNKGESTFSKEVCQLSVFNTVAPLPKSVADCKAPCIKGESKAMA